jgi:hypothetical protein
MWHVWGGEMCIKGFGGNGKNRVHWQDLGIDDRRIISILKKQWQCVEWINVAQARTNGKLF